MKNFIGHDSFLVKEHLSWVRNNFSVFDTEGKVVGSVQDLRTCGQVIIGTFLSAQCRAFNLGLFDSEGCLIGNIERDFTWFRSNVRVYDAGHQLCGTLEQKLMSLKPFYRMYDAHGVEFALLKGNFLAWDFMITALDGRLLGSVNKKFNGVVNELFTTKDKYITHISVDVVEPAKRLMIASAACAIDMMLKENG